MNVDFDLTSYVERIGYDGPLEPTAETLRQLHRRHVQTFPFENLNPLLRWAVPLDAPSLQHKMVRGRRGGYCFEQNLLFCYALQAVGFRVVGLAARVLSNRPPGSMPARTHMLLLVEAEGDRWLSDTGFGSMTMAEPIRLKPGAVQPTTHETRRATVLEPATDLAAEAASAAPVSAASAASDASYGREFLMEADVRGEWRPLFRFSLEPQTLSDYEMANFYVSHRPGSHFTTDLTVARPTPTGRYGLRNNELAIHDLAGNTERRTLATAEEIRDALEDLFLIEVPSDPKLQHVLERLAGGETLDGR